MTLLNNLTLLSEQEFTLRFTGTVNIESGWAELKSLPFSSCTDCSEIAAFTVNCQSCGRSEGASYSFLAGDGDGVYSSVGWFDPETKNLVASMWVFDENALFASKVDDETRASAVDSNSVLGALIDAVRPFVDLQGIPIGQVTSNGQDLTVTDRNFRPTLDVEVPLPFSEGGSFELLAFMENVEESSLFKRSLQQGVEKNLLNGGLNESVRPRVLLVVNTQWAATLMGSKQSAQTEINWEHQINAWKSMFVYCNLPGTENGKIAAFNNGIVSLKYSEDLLVRSPEGMFYSLETVSWLLQAAFLGDGDAHHLAIEFINLNIPQLSSNPDAIKRLLASHGCEENEELEKFVESLTN